MHPCIYSPTHASTHMQTRIRTHKYLHTQKGTQICDTHAWICTHTQACTGRDVCKHTYKYVYTCTHMLTHISNLKLQTIVRAIFLVLGLWRMCSHVLFPAPPPSHHPPSPSRRLEDCSLAFALKSLPASEYQLQADALTDSLSRWEQSSLRAQTP